MYVRPMHIIHIIVYRCCVNQPSKCLIDLAWPNYSLPWHCVNFRVEITATLLNHSSHDNNEDGPQIPKHHKPAVDNHLLKPMSLDQSYNFMEMENVSLIKISFGYQKSLRSSSSIDWFPTGFLATSNSTTLQSSERHLWNSRPNAISRLFMLGKLFT